MQDTKQSGAHEILNFMDSLYKKGEEKLPEYQILAQESKIPAQLDQAFTSLKDTMPDPKSLAFKMFGKNFQTDTEANYAITYAVIISQIKGLAAKHEDYFKIVEESNNFIQMLMAKYECKAEEVITHVAQEEQKEGSTDNTDLISNTSLNLLERIKEFKEKISHKTIEVTQNSGLAAFWEFQLSKPTGFRKFFDKSLNPAAYLRIRDYIENYFSNKQNVSRIILLANPKRI